MKRNPEYRIISLPELAINEQFKVVFDKVILHEEESIPVSFERAGVYLYRVSQKGYKKEGYIGRLSAHRSLEPYFVEFVAFTNNHLDPSIGLSSRALYSRISEHVQEKIQALFSNFLSAYYRTYLNEAKKAEISKQVFSLTTEAIGHGDVLGQLSVYVEPVDGADLRFDSSGIDFSGLKICCHFNRHDENEEKVAALCKDFEVSYDKKYNIFWLNLSDVSEDLAGSGKRDVLKFSDGVNEFEITYAERDSIQWQFNNCLRAFVNRFIFSYIPE